MSVLEKVHRFYTEDLTVRASFVETTQLCTEIAEIHSTFPIATILLGRLVTGTVLLASQLWEQQSLSVRIEGDGPIGHLYAESSFEGKTRAYVSHPELTLPPLPTGHLNLKSAIGNGVLIVNRNVPFQKHPQSGIVPIVCGEISKDLAYYLQQSQQTPSVISLSVSLDETGKVIAAGGVLLELIAGAPDSIIRSLEQKAETAPSLSKLILEKTSPIEILKYYCHSSAIQTVDHPYSLSYFCRCSMERVERTLSLMGRGTLAEMALKGDEVEVKCEFCSRMYLVPITKIKELLLKVDSGPTS